MTHVLKHMGIDLTEEAINLQNTMNIGSAPNTAISGQPFNPSASAIPTSHPQNVTLPTLATAQPPSNLSASTPIMSILENTERTTSQRSTDLVKPSTFFGPPPSSAGLVIPPVSSSVPTAPPLNAQGNLQRPYGAPLLQPFPPPTPPQSLTPTAPTPNYGPPISREKVRDALQSLVQVCITIRRFLKCASKCDFLHCYKTNIGIILTLMGL